MDNQTTSKDNMRKYGDPRSIAEIKSLPRTEMVSTAKACCMLEHLTDAEIDAATVSTLRREIDAVNRMMESIENGGDY